MKRSYIILGSVLAAIGGFIPLTSCSGDNSNPDGGLDGGDASKPDVKKQPDVGTGEAEAGPITTPAGTQLAASDKIQIFGITSDNYVIYADNSAASALFAVIATGATAPVKIASPPVSSTSTYVVGIAGKVVFLWEGISTAKNAAQVGALSLWTSSGTLHTATTMSAPTAGFASSTDGSHVIFSANSNTGATLGDFDVAVSDGSGIVPLVQTVDLGVGTCTPQVGFAGGTTPVTATCSTAPPDGGTPVATVSSYGTSAPWTAVPIITSAINFWATDTAGDHLLVSTPTPSLQIFPTGTATGSTVDSKSVQGGFGYLTKNGVNALYSTSAGDLWTSPVVSPSPLELQTTGVKYVRSISADESHIIYSTTLDSMQFGGDLYLASTTSAAAPTTLITGLLGALFGVVSSDDFTADSNYVMWIENLDSTHGTGDLYAMAVASGTPKQITTVEWQNASATGSKIVFNDNCQGCSGTAAAGTADLRSVDVSTNNTPSTIQTSADVTFALDNPRTHIVYSYSQNAPSTGTPPLGGNGLYAVAIP